MSTQARVKQLEKQAAQNKADSPLKSWKDFIDWCNGVLKFDTDTEALLQKEWGEFIAKAEAAPTANTSQNTRA